MTPSSVPELPGLGRMAHTGDLCTRALHAAFRPRGAALGLRSSVRPYRSAGMELPVLFSLFPPFFIFITSSSVCWPMLGLTYLSREQVRVPRHTGETVVVTALRSGFRKSACPAQAPGCLPRQGAGQVGGEIGSPTLLWRNRF